MKTENHYTETDLGNISLNPRGEYDPEAFYEYLDTVSMDGGSYMCLAELGTKITGTPPVPGINTEHWQLLTLPGGLTPEYITMHDEVTEKAKQVEVSRAAVELSQSEIEAMQEDVTQLHEDTQDSAQSALVSKNQAAGYASAADMSRQAAERAKQDVDAQIPNIDAKLQAALNEIDTARQSANTSVKKREELSVQAVRDQTGAYITEQKNLAKQELDEKVNTFELDVDAIKKQVSAEGAKQVEATRTAGNTAVQEIGTVKSTAVQEVADTGAQQVQLVKTEGQKQLTDVQEAAAAVNTVIDQRKAEINDTAVEEIKEVQGEGSAQTKKVADEATKQIADIRAAGGTLESAVDRYYAMRRGKDIYTVEVLDSTTTQACTVNRLDGLAGLVCEPSTNATKGRDDVGALDAFRPTLCNWVLDAEGNQHITALQGMANYTEEGKVNVGVLNMGLYYMKERNSADNGWLHHWSMLPRADEGYKPMKECVRPDGTVQGFMIHPRGAAVDVNGVPYGSNGNPKRNGPSFGNYTYPREQGPAYCAETDVDAAWVLALTMIKYGTRDLQAYMRGCTAYTYQYQVSVAETDTNRVILTTSQANEFVIGSCISIGNPGDNTNRDRYYAYMHNIVDSAEIVAIEVIDDSYSALVLDVDAPFTTTTNAWVSTMHWRSGSTSKVLGYDGSPVSNTDGKNICKINEIEVLPGGYSVCGNSIHIMEADAEGATTCKMYKTDSSLLLSTNTDTIQSTWKEVGTIPVTNDSWQYIKDQYTDFSEGIYYPTAYGGGDKTYWADAIHTGTNLSAGTKATRERLLRGSLHYGGLSGPSCVDAYAGLPNAYWFFLLTLSPNAVRGEWQASA